MGKIIMSLMVLGILGTVANAQSSAQVGQLSDINAQLQKNGADQNYGDMQQGLDGLFSGSGAKAKNNDTPVYMDQSKAADHTQHCPGCPGSPTPDFMHSADSKNMAHTAQPLINTQWENSQPWFNHDDSDKPAALKMSADGRIGYVTAKATYVPPLKTETAQQQPHRGILNIAAVVGVAETAIDVVHSAGTVAVNTYNSYEESQLHAATSAQHNAEYAHQIQEHGYIPNN